MEEGLRPDQDADRGPDPVRALKYRAVNRSLSQVHLVSYCPHASAAILHPYAVHRCFHNAPSLAPCLPPPSHRIPSPDSTAAHLTRLSLSPSSHAQKYFAKIGKEEPLAAAYAESPPFPPMSLGTHGGSARRPLSPVQMPGASALGGRVVGTTVCRSPQPPADPTRPSRLAAGAGGIHGTGRVLFQNGGRRASSSSSSSFSSSASSSSTSSSSSSSCSSTSTSTSTYGSSPSSSSALGVLALGALSENAYFPTGESLQGLRGLQQHAMKEDLYGGVGGGQRLIRDVHALEGRLLSLLQRRTAELTQAPAAGVAAVGAASGESLGHVGRAGLAGPAGGGGGGGVSGGGGAAVAPRPEQPAVAAAAVAAAMAIAASSFSSIASISSVSSVSSSVAGTAEEAAGGGAMEAGCSGGSSAETSPKARAAAATAGHRRARSTSMSLEQLEADIVECYDQAHGAFASGGPVVRGRRGERDRVLCDGAQVVLGFGDSHLVHVTKLVHYICETFR